MIPGIHWEIFKPGVFLAPLGLLALAGALFLLWVLASSLRERRNRRAWLHRLAADHAHRVGLNAEEAKLLLEITLAEGEPPHAASFERQVELLLRRDIPADTLRTLRFKLGFHITRFGQRLFSTRECEPGQDVTLSRAPYTWEGCLFDVDEHALLVKLPATALDILRVNDTVKVSLHRGFDAHYAFHTRITDFPDHVLPLVRLEHARELERMQERDYLRAEVSWKTDVTLLAHEPGHKSAAAERRGPLAATILDLSEGGIRLDAIPGAREGDHLVIPVPLDHQRHLVPLLTEIISLDADGVRGRFLKLGQSERDRIYRTILELERQSPPGEIESH